MAPLGRLALAGLLSTAFLAPQAWGQDCSVPVELPDKPRIENFADYNDFVVEIMKFKKKAREQQQHRKACPGAYVARERPNPDPTVIEGPETLGEALRRTRRLPEVDYSRNQTWYDRSTSRSFGLPSLSGEELSDRSIEARLQNLSAAMDEQRLAGLTPGERRRLSYEALAARRDGKEANLALAGADVLPLFHASDFRRDGPEGAYSVSEQLYYLLLMREQEVEEVTGPPGIYDSLSFVASTVTVRDQRLDVFLSDDGEPIRYSGLIQVENCLSSCVPD